MSRNVSVNIYCDLCSVPISHEIDTKPTSIRIGSTSYQADLCENCLRDLTQKFTKVKGAGPRTAVPTNCTVCGRTFPTHQGASTHRARAHGVYAPSNPKSRQEGPNAA